MRTNTRLDIVESARWNRMNQNKQSADHRTFNRITKPLIIGASHSHYLLLSTSKIKIYMKMKICANLFWSYVVIMVSLQGEHTRRSGAGRRGAVPLPAPLPRQRNGLPPLHLRPLQAGGARQLQGGRQAVAMVSSTKGR